MDRGAWQATVHGVTVRYDWETNTFTVWLTPLGVCTKFIVSMLGHSENVLYFADIHIDAVHKFAHIYFHIIESFSINS